MPAERQITRYDPSPSHCRTQWSTSSGVMGLLLYCHYNLPSSFYTYGEMIEQRLLKPSGRILQKHCPLLPTKPWYVHPMRANYVQILDCACLSKHCNKLPFLLQFSSSSSLSSRRETINVCHWACCTIFVYDE